MNVSELCESFNFEREISHLVLHDESLSLCSINICKY